MPDYSELLGQDGVFANKIPSFTPRDSQQTLAEAISSTIMQQTVLVAEAGTGTGKTFAYLVPALLSGRRVLISTGTRTLQDQLFHRDLPAVAQLLGMPAKVTLLKGRSNYICRHRLSLASHSSSDLFSSSEHVASLSKIIDWTNSTRSGDISELGGVQENSRLWPQVTSTVENCMGQSCPEYSKCYVLEARRRAQEADIVVVNHHLMMADMVLKEEGFSALLPGMDAVIVDEAHQLPDIASQYFSMNFSSRQLHELLKDCLREYRESENDSDGFLNILNAVEETLSDLHDSFPKLSKRVEWSDVIDNSELKSSLHSLAGVIDSLQQALAALADWSAGLKRCWQRISGMFEQLGQFIDDEEGDEHIRWIEGASTGFSLNQIPMNSAERFQSCIADSDNAWVFLSATLSINGSFEHFRNQLGLEQARELLLGSPFDYEHNALLYLPEGLPDVNTPGYTTEVIHAAIPVIRASGGRTFLLFTSHRALQEAAALIRDELEFPLLVQGEAPRGRLLERFRAFGNAVLLGTASFWEGVDVKGPALSVVMIDRLPFASPADPVVKARLASIARQGGEPFIDYQLPLAVLALKQGVGRLIRDDSDRGVLMLCDPRITGRGYGKLFLASLPPMHRTKSLDVVRKFLSEIPPLSPGRVV